MTIRDGYVCGNGWARPATTEELQAHAAEQMLRAAEELKSEQSQPVLSSNLRLLKTPTSGRIVELLEELLAQAKAGKVTGIFLFAESIEGNVTHSRDGMSDSLVVFWLELIKRRILGRYETEERG